MRLSRLLLSVIAVAIFLAARKSRAYKRLRVRMRLLLLVGTIALLCSAHAQTPPLSASPALEQLVADLEAYINNSPRGADTKSATASNIAGPGPSYNAWMMTCAALVLFMTLPGLALFYGGLVRAKNVLSVLAQCLGIAGLVTIVWWVIGYSLVFSRGSPFIGGLKFAFLHGVDARPNSDYFYWVSQDVFAMYQLMFAIITPALIIGAVAERMKFAAVLVFVGVWMFAVYFPIAHMVWGIDGWMNGVWNANSRITAIDFAGGTVVHMSSGWSALVLCILLGHRLGFRKEIMAPHSMVLCMVGTGLLWVGWYGFNAGSALAPDGIAANAFMTGIFATASINPNLSLSTGAPLNPATQNGLARIVGHTLWIEQLKAIVVTIVVAVVGSAVIGALVRGAIGLRIPPEIERQGLDINQHGEEGYITS